ncbi:hypothetical protein [Streptococcus suis]|uniref:hypothetical protein n=1 Tax=Streptococcus suis TaxID=1307 RepID=UPI000CF5434F|nr:hypothetical protein [Streptococcus suis]
MNHPIILFFKYWYITFPLLFILLSLYNKGDNDSSLNMQSKAKDEFENQEDEQKIYPIQNLSYYLTLNNQLILKSRNWIINLKEKSPYEYQTRDVLEQGYCILNEMEHFKDELHYAMRHVPLLSHYLDFIDILDGFTYEVKMRDPEQKEFVLTMSKLNSQGQPRNYLAESEMMYATIDSEDFREEVTNLIERVNAWMEDLENPFSYELQPRTKLNYAYAIITRLNELKEEFSSVLVAEISDIESLEFLSKLEACIEFFTNEVELRDPEKSKLVHLLDDDPDLISSHIQVVKYTNQIVSMIQSKTYHQELLAEHMAHYNLYEETLEKLAKIHFNPELFDHELVERQEIIDFIHTYQRFQQKAIKHLNKDEVREYQIARRLLDTKMSEFEYRDLLE